MTLRNRLLTLTSLLFLANLLIAHAEMALPKFSEIVARVVFSSEAKTLFQSGGDATVKTMVLLQLQKNGFTGPDLAHCETAAQATKFNELFALGKAAADAATVRAQYPALDANDKPSPNYVSLWTGAKLDNPYTISSNGVGSGVIQPNKTTTDGYIELRFDYSFISREGDAQALDPHIWDNNASYVPDDGTGHFIAPWYHLADFKMMVGYVFRGSSAPTNFDASAVVGSADLYSVAALGLPIWRKYDTGSLLQREQLSIEIAGGMATDKDHLIVHPTMFIGGGFEGAYYRNTGDNPPAKLKGMWCSRVGLAYIDRPRTQPDATFGTTVQLDAQGNPQFRGTWAPSLGFDITFPVTKVIDLQLGGNAYFTDTPAAWNLNLGVSLNLDNFFKALQ